jgi:hypothetical protein
VRALCWHGVAAWPTGPIIWMKEGGGSLADEVVRLVAEQSSTRRRDVEVAAHARRASAHGRTGERAGRDRPRGETAISWRSRRRPRVKSSQVVARCRAVVRCRGAAEERTVRQASGRVSRSSRASSQRRPTRMARWLPPHRRQPLVPAQVRWCRQRTPVPVQQHPLLSGCSCHRRPCYQRRNQLDRCSLRRWERPEARRQPRVPSPAGQRPSAARPPRRPQVLAGAAPCRAPQGLSSKRRRRLPAREGPPRTSSCQRRAARCPTGAALPALAA